MQNIINFILDKPLGDQLFLIGIPIFSILVGILYLRSIILRNKISYLKPKIFRVWHIILHIILSITPCINIAWIWCILWQDEWRYFDTPKWVKKINIFNYKIIK